VPYVKIKITKEGASTDQKAALIAGDAELLQLIFNKKPGTTVLVIDEVEADTCGVSGEQVTQRREKGCNEHTWYTSLGAFGG